MSHTRDFTRRELFAAAAVTGAALMAPEAAKAGVFPQNIVHYQAAAGDGGHQCKGCKLFLPGAAADATGACKSVSGVIYPNGWCKLWTDHET